jgi:hypothetical protein
MKKLILASLAVLLLAAGPAMAGEFQALSKLSVPGQTALKVMTDDQLAAVEGQGRRGRRGRNIDIQVAVNLIVQTNACGVCAGVIQSNAAAIISSIDQD